MERGGGDTNFSALSVKAVKQTSSTEDSGIAIDFVGWKMNNFFFSCFSLSLSFFLCMYLYMCGYNG